MTLALTESGDLDLRGGLGPVVVSGAEACRSFLLAIFYTQAGAWPFNRSFGVPYQDEILGKYFDDVAAAAIYADAASNAPGVATVPSSSVTFVVDTRTRQLSATIDPVITLSGDSFSFEVP